MAKQKIITPYSVGTDGNSGSQGVKDRLTDAGQSGGTLATTLNGSIQTSDMQLSDGFVHCSEHTLDVTGTDEDLTQTELDKALDEAFLQNQVNPDKITSLPSILKENFEGRTVDAAKVNLVIASNNKNKKHSFFINNVIVVSTTGKKAKMSGVATCGYSAVNFRLRKLTQALVEWDCDPDDAVDNMRFQALGTTILRQEIVSVGGIWHIFDEASTGSLQDINTGIAAVQGTAEQFKMEFDLKDGPGSTVKFTIKNFTHIMTDLNGLKDGWFENTSPGTNLGWSAQPLTGNTAGGIFDNFRVKVSEGTL